MKAGPDCQCKNLNGVHRFIFQKEQYSFSRKANTSLLLWTNKKHYKTKREAEEKGGKSETEEQKVKRLRKIREQQRQKLVNETVHEKGIRLAKKKEAYKKRSEETKGKRREYLRDREAATM